MENTEQAMLVFKDQAGEYYMLPQAVLERGRVPTERRTEFEEMIATAQRDIGGEDVAGHAIFGAFFVGFCIGYTTTSLIRDILD